MSNTATIIKTVCSGCWLDLTLDVERGVVLATIPSNGRRGQFHQPARDVDGDLYGDPDELLMWECPDISCEYSDSYDVNQ